LGDAFGDFDIGADIEALATYRSKIVTWAVLRPV
jgi:hypothetical protein